MPDSRPTRLARRSWSDPLPLTTTLASAERWPMWSRSGPSVGLTCMSERGFVEPLVGKQGFGLHQLDPESERKQFLVVRADSFHSKRHQSQIVVDGYDSSSSGADGSARRSSGDFGNPARASSPRCVRPYDELGGRAKGPCLVVRVGRVPQSSQPLERGIARRFSIMCSNDEPACQS